MPATRALMKVYFDGEGRQRALNSGHGDSDAQPPLPELRLAPPPDPVSASPVSDSFRVRATRSRSISCRRHAPSRIATTTEQSCLASDMVVVGHSQYARQGPSLRGGPTRVVI